MLCRVEEVTPIAEVRLGEFDRQLLQHIELFNEQIHFQRTNTELQLSFDSEWQSRLIFEFNIKGLFVFSKMRRFGGYRRYFQVR